MITQKIRLIAEGIKVAEGWLPNTYQRSDIPGSRSYRNHNPGNLRSSPFALNEHDSYAYFLDDEIGMFALLYDLHAKINGKSMHIKPEGKTLYDLLRVWVAPTEEGSFNNYVDIVERISEVKRDTPLTDLQK